MTTDLNKTGLRLECTIITTRAEHYYTARCPELNQRCHAPTPEKAEAWLKEQIRTSLLNELGATIYALPKILESRRRNNNLNTPFHQKNRHIIDIPDPETIPHKKPDHLLPKPKNLPPEVELTIITDQAGDRFTAHCPELELQANGPTAKKAEKALKEQVRHSLDNMDRITASALPHLLKTIRRKKRLNTRRCLERRHYFTIPDQAKPN